MSNNEPIYGYAGQILRVDLSNETITSEELDESILKKYVGGTALGIKYLYDEVPPGVEWSDSANRLFIGSGPLGGTRIGGSGSIAVVTKGALTDGMASSQANGFFGAFLKFSGFDGIVLQGSSNRWVYLYIHDGIAEIRDAAHLSGKNTFEVDHIIKEELQKKDREMSVLCIGPAGENLVKFACISVDRGHIAAHNGIGAVMGSKKVKAIAVDRGRNTVSFKDKDSISQLVEEILAAAMTDKMNMMTLEEGTVGGVIMGTKTGTVPVKNYSTSVHNIDPDKLDTYTSQNIRSRFKAKPAPCWACKARHCHEFEITDGKYAGRILEEPEYEAMAAFSSLIGVDDVNTTVLLASEVDHLGMDVNETGWVLAWLMECCEKGILTAKDTDGLEMTWGDGEAMMVMLKKIAQRQGFGNILAEGVMRAAQQIGGEALNQAIHTQKGNTPRSHDHRAMWFELFDTCVSSLGTIEAHGASVPYKLLGLSPLSDPFDPEAVSTIVAKSKGAMIFVDSLVTCRFQTLCQLDLLSQAVNAATGWNLDYQEAMTIGKRAVNLARVFNLRHGINSKLDAPSVRYGSTPVDGVVAGRGILEHWDNMLLNYYKHMGWDENGQPLPETLKKLGLD